MYILYHFPKRYKRFTLHFIFRRETEIGELKETAEKAIKASNEAFEITKDAVNQQKNIRYCVIKIYLFNFHHCSLRPTM